LKSEGKTKQINTNKKNKGMEEEQRNYNHEDDVRGLCVSMGNVRKQTNRHGEVKEQSINLVETINHIQRNFHIYKYDNERLMKSKEQQDGFNINFL
jgi:hypothetical protein